MPEKHEKMISRRTVAKGMAWTVPVATVATAAPAFAASPEEPIDPSFSPGTFCKHPSDNHYHAVFCFENTTAEEIPVSLTMFEIDPQNDGTFDVVPGSVLPATVTIDAGTECCIMVDAGPAASMANGTGRLWFTYEYGGETLESSVKTEFKNSIDNCQNVSQPKDLADAHVRTC